MTPRFVQFGPCTPVAYLIAAKPRTCSGHSACFSPGTARVPTMSEEDVTAKVDKLIGLALKSSNRPTTEQEEA